MNIDNIYDVLPGEEDYDEEEDASPEETPPQPTRQGLPGERSPNARALAAARAAAARRTRLRQDGVRSQQESDGDAAARTRSGADPSDDDEGLRSQNASVARSLSRSPRTRSTYAHTTLSAHTAHATHTGGGELA